MIPTLVVLMASGNSFLQVPINFVVTLDFLISLLLKCKCRLHVCCCQKPLFVCQCFQYRYHPCVYWEIFRSAENMAMMNLSINDVPSIAETASKYITPNRTRTFRSPTCMKLWRTPTVLISFLEAYLCRTLVNGLIS